MKKLFKSLFCVDIEEGDDGNPNYVLKIPGKPSFIGTPKTEIMAYLELMKKVPRFEMKNRVDFFSSKPY